MAFAIAGAGAGGASGKEIAAATLPVPAVTSGLAAASVDTPFKRGGERTALPGPMDRRLTDPGKVVARRSEPLFSVSKLDAVSRKPNFAQQSMRCLATAVYFESRGEPVAGQYAVAHVIANRVRSRLYPNSVCEVVYQNWTKKNRCQFSFACDGKPDIAKNARAWSRAVDVARTVLGDASGPVATSIRASTHFHATYVRPGWARKLTRTGLVGRHIFYVTYRS